MRLFRLIFGEKKKPKNISLLKELLRNPDNFNYNIEVVRGEIVIKIKKIEGAN